VGAAEVGEEVLVLNKLDVEEVLELEFVVVEVLNEQ